MHKKAGLFLQTFSFSFFTQVLISERETRDSWEEVWVFFYLLEAAQLWLSKDTRFKRDPTAWVTKEKSNRMAKENYRNQGPSDK